MNLFLELVQVSLGTRDRLSRTPSTAEWVDLYNASQTQAVVGIMADGLERLPQDQLPKKELLLQWIGLCQMIEAQNALHQSVLIKTRDCLANGGVSVAFMKGLVCGSRYTDPKRRASGDIDFVVAEKDFDKTLDLLEAIGTVDRDLIHEHHGMAFVDEVQLEPHFKVHNFQNPSVDDAMQEMFAEVFPQELIEVEIGGEKIPVFPPAFECALLVGHMVNHVYAEGLGMRQVIDLMMFIQKEHEIVKSEECQRYLSRMKMERAFRVFSCVCEDYLGMSHELLNLNYRDKEKRFAGKIMADILEVGNFGRGADYLGKDKALRPLRSYLWVVGRCIKLGYLCPAEACWWPVSKFRRFLWKKSVEKSRPATH